MIGAESRQMTNVSACGHEQILEFYFLEIHNGINSCIAAAASIANHGKLTPPKDLEDSEVNDAYACISSTKKKKKNVFVFTSHHGLHAYEKS